MNHWSAGVHGVAKKALIHQWYLEHLLTQVCVCVCVCVCVRARALMSVGQQILSCAELGSSTKCQGVS